MYETITSRSDKLAIANLNKVLGPEWIERYIKLPKRGFLRCEKNDTTLRETTRMRRIALSEMLFNLQDIPGFESCQAVDRGLSSSLRHRKQKPRDYDLEITFSDGVNVNAETKCKLEETKITLRTIEETLGHAKKDNCQRQHLESYLLRYRDCGSTANNTIV
jgi:hypothetical protein